ncbi:antitoxin [Caedibacter taeniospiralis]|uniref:antitoxin n=1 Tax=Caedibacter taeniospiralis TaxID=28907 RepID=UPI000C26DD21|nr:type II toxin-antitoxin system VapB family antitoxin [Caedibacter taeniospiralis]
MIATVFKNGNSQAVRIPKALQIHTNKVDITKVGSALVIRELPQSWDEAFQCLSEFEDFMIEGKSDFPPQTREEFK